MSLSFMPLQKGRILLNLSIVAYFEWRKDSKGEDEVLVVFKSTSPQESVVWKGEIARELHQRMGPSRRFWGRLRKHFPRLHNGNPE